MSTPIRIAFVVPGVYAYFNPGSGCPPGGSERQALLLGNALAERGDVDVMHVVPDHGQPERETTQTGVGLWRAHRYGTNPWRQIRVLSSVLRSMNADIYVFRSAGVGVAVGIALVHGHRRRIVYMLAHDDECQLRTLARCVGMPGALSMTYAYRLPSCIVAQTQWQADRFARCRRRPVAGVVPNICVVAPDVGPERSLRLPMLLWVGRAQAWKRGDAFLQLARHFSETPCVMVCGPGSASCEARWRRAAMVLPNVQFHGAMPHAELATLYRAASLLVNTSSAEGVPNVMLEAMAHGCPVLSAVVDPDGALNEGRAGVCVGSLDADALAQACGTLLSSPDDCQAMGRNARAWVAREHAPALAANRFMALQGRGPRAV